MDRTVNCMVIAVNPEGRVEGHKRKKGKGHQGTCIKDPWTKTMAGGD